MSPSPQDFNSDPIAIVTIIQIHAILIAKLANPPSCLWGTAVSMIQKIAAKAIAIVRPPKVYQRCSGSSQAQEIHP